MNLKNKNNLKKIAIFAIVVLAVVSGVLLTFRLAFFLLPFLIAFALSSLMEPLIKLSRKKLRISRNISAPIMLLIMLATIITLVVLAVLRLIEEIRGLVIAAPQLLSDLYIQINSLIIKGSEYFELPVEITSNLGSVISNLSDTITNFGKTVVKGAFVTAISLPEALIFTIITVLATFFMTKDREKITSVLVHQLPESWIHRILAIKKDLFNALFGYMRAALMMMMMTFTEVFVGLSIIRIEYALLLAFLIAIIDALPILGAGSILIPWSLYSFVTGDIQMGVSIMVLYLVVLIIRQTVEPKVVGQQIGVYPLLTLMAMYTGLKTIGFAGLILGPITFLLIRNILITIYKKRSLKEIIGLNSPIETDNADTDSNDTKPPNQSTD